tara:strand:- start:62 stop:442 length:381 start_codon:yes stop_codon:yes gene_type:complete
MVSICLFFIVLIGWTITTYFIKKETQKLIREELKNLFEIFNKFFASIKRLIGVLANNSFYSQSNKTNPGHSKVLDEDEQPLNLVGANKKIEGPSLEIPREEDIDTALSSFSPEVVEIINEEEEKVA